MTTNNNFYFWLGADGDLNDLENEEAFAQRVEEDAKGRNAWLNVVETDEGFGG